MISDNVLDMTKFDELSKDQLKEAILDGVKNTQSEALLMPLPDTLIIRQDQYDLLQDDPDLQNMYQSKDRLYATNLNVMEVRVQGFTA